MTSEGMNGITVPRMKARAIATECCRWPELDRSEVLRQVKRETGITQLDLGRLSGVHQPSISRFLSPRSNSATNNSTEAHSRAPPEVDFD
jgi:hypothetical protein